MKFDIFNRFSGKVQFSAEIECEASASVYIKRGLAAKWAYKSGAVLSGAVLSDAVLSGAVLSGAVLSGAVLSGAVLSGAVLSDAVLSDADLSDADLRDAVLRGAVLSGADLRDAVLRGAVLSGAVLSDAVLSGAVLSGADLSGAVLSGADLRGAVLSGADLSDVPLVPNIDAAILAAIEENKAKKTNGFDMRTWHGAECDETNWCNTTHCRAGYAICLAGKAGFDLERKVGSAMAGTLLYLKSTPDAPIPNWSASDADALDDMRERAAKQLAASS